MNFDHVIQQPRDTEVIMAEIQRRQAELQKWQAEGLELHEKRMAHIDMRLASITSKLGLLRGYFEGPN